MRNDAGEQIYNIAQMPVDICVADSQGGIGYMIERIFRNVLNKHGIGKNVVCIVTVVLGGHQRRCIRRSAEEDRQDIFKEGSG